jgi:hypothetical protein
MWRSSPSSIKGSFTAITNAISPANAASICPPIPDAPPLRLVASNVSAPATANNKVHPSGTSTTAITACPHTLIRCESSGIGHKATNSGPAQYASANTSVSATFDANRPAANATPTITKNAPNTPPAPTSNAPPKRTVTMLARPFATTGNPRIACVNVFVAATICSTNQR